MRATACFSMYSDMSSRTSAFSSSNRNSASARAVSVFPTPGGAGKCEGAGGGVGVLQAGRAPPYRVGHRGERLRLPDHAAGQLILQMRPTLRSEERRVGKEWRSRW